MELFIGLVVAAVAVYFIFFRKKEEIVSAPTVTVEDVAANAEVVAVEAPAKKAPATKKAPAAKTTPAAKKTTARKPKAK
jgi:hypothetical protein